MAQHYQYPSAVCNRKPLSYPVQDLYPDPIPGVWHRRTDREIAARKRELGSHVNIARFFKCEGEFAHRKEN